ncbi:hypothetical protein AB4560_01480 [Vibrio sp. 10N.222.51.C12]|uniref:hypothetical protein n=1 Tax=Vibrio sp. 10N.222.51.C12 TaxID=3229622 RepID=UPI00354D600E
MVNQSIEQLLQQAVDQSMAQTQESRELADDVSGLIGEIRNEVAQAVQRTDEVIGRVDVAIPTAINDEMYQYRYIDPTNGSDANSGKNAANALQTLKAAIDSVPVGCVVCIRAADGVTGLVVDVNDSIESINKHIILYLADCTLNLNAQITMYGGSFKNYYKFKEVAQSIEFGFMHYSTDIRVEVEVLTPTGQAICLFKQTHTSGSVSKPGSHHSHVLFQGEVSDSDVQYYVFAPQHYKASMIVTTYNLTLGENVGLFDPIYSTVQVGTKGVYLVGA